jgi:hypothetical protein
MVVGGVGLPVRVLAIDAGFVRVTHPANLPVVTVELGLQVVGGMRPSSIFAAVAVADADSAEQGGRPR